MGQAGLPDNCSTTIEVSIGISPSTKDVAVGAPDSRDGQETAPVSSAGVSCSPLGTSSGTRPVSAPPTAFFPPRGPIPTMPPWQGQPAHQLPNPLSTKQFYHCPATQSIRPLATKPSRQRRNARPEPVTRAKSIYLSCPASIKRLRVSTHRFGASSSTRRTGYSPITARISCK